MEKGTIMRLPEATKDHARLRDDIATSGYAILADALAPDLLAALRTRVLDQAAGEVAAGVAYCFGDDLTGMPGSVAGDAPAPNQRIGNLLNKGRVFRELLTHPVVDAVVPGMFGGPPLLSSLSAMIMRRGGVPQVLHSDQQFVPFQTPIPMVCNIVWMLVDFCEANGATRVVPGTHLLPPPELGIERDADGTPRLIQPQVEEVIAEAPAGSALIFDGRLWHGAGANRTDVPRPAIFSYYCQPYLRQQENMPLGLRSDVYDAMEDPLRAMIGFDAYKRGMGRITDALGRTNTNWVEPGVGELSGP